MITMTPQGSAFSPFKFPKIFATVYPDVLYLHSAERVSATTLKLSITVTIGVTELDTKKHHKMMNGTSRFIFESDEKLTLDKLYEAWEGAFKAINLEFLKKLRNGGMNKMTLTLAPKPHLASTMEQVLNMFNNTPFVPSK